MFLVVTIDENGFVIRHSAHISSDDALEALSKFENTYCGLIEWVEEDEDLFRTLNR